MLLVVVALPLTRAMCSLPSSFIQRRNNIFFFPDLFLLRSVCRSHHLFSAVTLLAFIFLCCLVRRHLLPFFFSRTKGSSFFFFNASHRERCDTSFFLFFFLVIPSTLLSYWRKDELEHTKTSSGFGETKGETHAFFFSFSKLKIDMHQVNLLSFNALDPHRHSSFDF